VPFLWKKKFAVADDQRFKREVDAMGVKCCILCDADALKV
jgi:hypothetical protein